MRLIIGLMFLALVIPVAGGGGRALAAGFDYGDAPATYGTAASAGTGPRLGFNVDNEDGPRFSADALGDDADVNPDDEDGVLNIEGLGVVPCGTFAAQVRVTGAAGTLYAWWDFDADGSFTTGSDALGPFALPLGVSTVDLPVPCSAPTGFTFIRFRLTTETVVTPTSFISDGETEDYRVTIGYDYGDAPASYGAASHSSGGPTLGALKDGEAAAQSSANADGDDLLGLDDEDAIPPGTTVARCIQGPQVFGQSTTAPGLAFDGWGDWNHDGDLDPDEQFWVGLRSSSTSASFPIVVPCRALAGPTVVRLRIRSAALSSPLPYLGPTASGPDGEVEDHVITITDSTLGVSVSTPGGGAFVSGLAMNVHLGMSDADPPVAQQVDVPLVTLSLASGTGALTCTGGLVHPAYRSGTPAIAGCAIHGTGSFTIRASSPGFADAISAPITVAAPPAQFGFLRAYTLPAVPSTIILNGARRDTWGTTWMKLPVGTYVLSFTDFPGFETPAPQAITIANGLTTDVPGVFSQLGVLRVDTSPPVPATISVESLFGQVPRTLDDWGVFAYARAGQYRLCFGPVAGFTPPPCQDVTVVAPNQTSVTAIYTPSAGAPGPDPNFGYLRTYGTPGLGVTFGVNAPFQTNNFLNTWATTWSKNQAGTIPLQLSVSGHPGFTTPPPQPVLILPGQTSEVPLAFGVDGILRVETSPPVPGTITVDGIPRNDWGVFTWLPAATYTVCFGPVPGYTAPPCQPATLTPGNQATIVGVYTPN